MKNMELDFMQIAEGARAFYNAGRCLISNEFEKCPTEYAAIPFYTNTAFACELFMKAIIISREPYISIADLKRKGHCLDVLFKALPNDIQLKIKDAIPDDKINSNQEELSAEYKKLIEGEASPVAKKIAKYALEYPASNFDEILKRNSKLFEKWRYFYEATDSAPILCDEWFLSTLCTALHNVMVNIINSQKSLGDI